METQSLALVAACAVLALGAGAILLGRLRAAERRAAEAARRAQAQGRCLGMIARELEAPGLSLLGLAARLPPAMAPDVEAEARRLLVLSEEVADHLLAQPGPRGLAEARLVLGPLLHEAVDEVSRLMGEEARHWRITPEAEELVLLADRRALRRALAQSLSRAARETRSGDRIVLRVVRAAETVALVIEDEGAGLPRDDLSGLNEGTRGLSLGLAAARELMRAHGGELTLETAPGIGARTWLTLPRARVLEDQAAG
ncbi:sensor histidine kinase [Roseomonas nepalensis]|uniref:histidine kinase n=1 Tax=Muricoccus nepalensis TaxID=1854500 RepID=A0A502FV55_9PROT|nr:sensor histidine kinase [Roseomonas nepalensis]TPG53355.1 sensor histidine kinase [Roseomonas nepalensis]